MIRRTVEEGHGFTEEIEMIHQNEEEIQFNPINSGFKTVMETNNTEDKRPTHLRIRIQIPKEYNQEPVISRLIAQYGLTVNVKAALLSASTQEDGWFDLELEGTKSQIQSGLIYLDELNVKLWSKSTDPEEENW